MVAGIIIAGGGNLDDYSLSQATAVRAKNKVLGKVGEGIKKKFSSIVNKKKSSLISNMMEKLSQSLIPLRSNLSRKKELQSLQSHQTYQVESSFLPYQL